MNGKPFSIFLSCGTPDTQVHESFIAAVETHLRSHYCEPQTVGRSKFSGRQPVQAARDLIGTCEGAVVIAFERTRILQGIDRPDSAEPKEFRNESHPTIWNQMEASMAYAQRVPILTLVQRGLKRQGMLSTRLEWVALEKELVPSLLMTEEFRQVFDEWMSLVQKTRAEPKSLDLDPEKIKIRDLISQFTAKQLFGLVVSIFGLLSALAGFSFRVGQLYQPH